MKDFEAIRKLQEETPVPATGSLWRHYKGGLYEVFGHCMKESTQEIEVLYNNIEHPMAYPWSRPLKEWEEIVDGGKKRYEYVDG